MANFINNNIIIIGADYSRKTDDRELGQIIVVKFFISVFILIYPDTRSLDQRRDLLFTHRASQ